jgi:hypothetical protein
MVQNLKLQRLEEKLQEVVSGTWWNLNSREA